MDYTTYTVEDLVSDEYFIQWVKRPTEESNAFWEAWLSKNPQHKHVVREAREMILLFQFTENKPPQGKFLEVWSNILKAENQNSFELSKGSPSISTTPDKHTFKIWYKVAAAAGVILAAVLLYAVVNHTRTITIRTAFGESRTLFLPDSTKVTLNANSVLQYAAAFNDNKREVWLDGEAFFSVVHKKNNQNFLVHTHELRVEVLGTRFNVNTRRGKSQVVLEEGKVKLAIQGDTQHPEPVMMKPGEFVEVSRETKQVEKKNVEVANYSSWRVNKLVFVGNTLEEIAQLLEDNYGYEIEFRDEALKKLQFTGSAAVDNPAELLQKLIRIFDLDVQQDDNHLIIQ